MINAFLLCLSCCSASVRAWAEAPASQLQSECCCCCCGCCSLKATLPSSLNRSEFCGKHFERRRVPVNISRSILAAAKISEFTIQRRSWNMVWCPVLQRWYLETFLSLLSDNNFLSNNSFKSSSALIDKCIERQLIADHFSHFSNKNVTFCSVQLLNCEDFLLLLLIHDNSGRVLGIWTAGWTKEAI